MGSIVILILQVVCLVCMIVAIVHIGRTLRNVMRTNEITEKAWGYIKTMRTDLEVKFKEVDDVIASLQRRAKKKGNENGG